MPPKDSKRRLHLDKARPHYIKCDICDINIKCQKELDSNDDEEKETLSLDVDDRDLVKEISANVKNLTVLQKAEIVGLIFRSETDSIWEDQLKAGCNLSKSTVKSITDENGEHWYAKRHPLLKTIAEELSQVTKLTYIYKLICRKTLSHVQIVGFYLILVKNV